MLSFNQDYPPLPITEDPRVSFSTAYPPIPKYLVNVAPARIKFAANSIRENLKLQILTAEDVIRKAYTEQPDTTVSFSGGKDSALVLWMTIKIAKEFDIDVVANFNDTLVEFPETYEFIDYIVDEWPFKLITLKPDTTYWKCVKEYGWPQLRSHKYRGGKHGKDGRPMCCQLLKEKVIKKGGFKSTLTGLRAAESRMRCFAIAQRGQYYYAKTLKRHQWHPIGLWSYEAVWAYHKIHNLPHNKVYDMGHTRCGCWPCTGFTGWKEVLHTSHPKMFRALMKLKGEPTLWEFFKLPLDTDHCADFETEEALY